MGRGGSSTASPSSSEVFRQASSSQCEQEVDPSSVSQEGAQVSLQQLRSKVSLTDQQLENISNDFVRYVLFASFSKTPVRRDQIRAKVLKDYSSSSRWTFCGLRFLMLHYRGLYPYLLAAAQKTLADIFGFELKELPRKKGSAFWSVGCVCFWIDKDLLWWYWGTPSKSLMNWSSCWSAILRHPKQVRWEKLSNFGRKC